MYKYSNQLNKILQEGLKNDIEINRLRNLSIKYINELIEKNDIMNLVQYIGTVHNNLKSTIEPYSLNYKVLGKRLRDNLLIYSSECNNNENKNLISYSLIQNIGNCYLTNGSDVFLNLFYDKELLDKINKIFKKDVLRQFKDVTYVLSNEELWSFLEMYEKRSLVKHRKRIKLYNKLIKSYNKSDKNLDLAFRYPNINLHDRILDNQLSDVFGICNNIINKRK